MKTEEEYIREEMKKILKEQLENSPLRTIRSPFKKKERAYADERAG